MFPQDLAILNLIPLDVVRFVLWEKLVGIVAFLALTRVTKVRVAPATVDMNKLPYIIVTLIIVSSLLGAGCSADSSSATYPTSPQSNPSVQNTITKDEAISGHWNEVKDYLPSSTTVEACSDSSGNCYDLDADVSGGSVDRVNFDNGGYLDFGASIDSDGTTSSTDDDGNNWNFQVSQDDLDQAAQDWADNKGVAIE